jgi:hypothetical protein
VDLVMSVARVSGSVLHFIVASAHGAWVDSQRGRLTAAAGAMRDAIDRAIELGLLFPTAMTLSYGIDVLVERPEAADLRSLAETLDLVDMMDFLAGAIVFAVRGRLRAHNRLGSLGWRVSPLRGIALAALVHI